MRIVLLGLAALGRCNHPKRHAATAGPGVLGVLRIAILRRDAALALAALAEDLIEGKTLLLGHVRHFLPKGDTLGALLFDHYAIDLRRSSANSA